jgi:hypothetical protein
MKLRRSLAQLKSPRPRVLFPSIVLFGQRHAYLFGQTLSKRRLSRAARVMTPAFFALTLAGTAHAQGTMDFSGAQTLMGTFNYSSFYDSRSYPHSASRKWGSPVARFRCFSRSSE